MCVQKDCNAPDAESALARALPDGLFRVYRAAQDAVVEQRLFEELAATGLSGDMSLEAARREFENANNVARPSSLQCVYYILRGIPAQGSQGALHIQESTGMLLCKGH